MDGLLLLTNPILDIHTMRAKISNDKIDALLTLTGIPRIKECWSALPRFNCGEW